MVPPGESGYGPLKLREDVTTRMMYPSSSDGQDEAKLLPRFLGPGYKAKHDWGKVHDTVDGLYKTLPQVPYTQEYTEKQSKPLASFRDWLDRAPEHVTAGYKGYASLGLAEAAQADGPGSRLENKTQGSYNLQNWLTRNVDVFNKTKEFADQATKEARERFTADELHNGIGDAYRHTRWHELMARELCTGTALTMGAIHELDDFIKQYIDDGFAGLRFDEAKMDMKNNWEGAIGQDANASLNAGKLVTIKKDGSGANEDNY